MLLAVGRRSYLITVLYELGMRGNESHLWSLYADAVRPRVIPGIICGVIGASTKQAQHSLYQSYTMRALRRWNTLIDSQGLRSSFVVIVPLP